jgi:hypothetical protein
MINKFYKKKKRKQNIPKKKVYKLNKWLKMRNIKKNKYSKNQY